MAPFTQIIHTQGSPYEIGRQHAEQIGRGAIEKGMVFFFPALWKAIFHSPSHSKAKKAIMRAIQGSLEASLFAKLKRNIPSSLQETLFGMADAAGLSRDELLLSVLLPDIFPLLQSLFCRMAPSHFCEMALPHFGCTSFAYCGKEFWIGRNLDFPGVGFWDQNQVLQCIRPEKGIPYIAITSAGVPFGGISGINQEKIYVALHQHYSKEYSLSGYSAFYTGEKILASARTISEAIIILEKARFANAWAFILADGKTKEAVIVEVNPTQVAIRRWEAKQQERKPLFLAHSNFFHSPTLQAKEYATTARMCWDNFARYQNLIQPLQKLSRQSEEMDAVTAVKLISQNYDPFWKEEKVANRTVSQLYNIQSFVLNLDKMQLWLAEGPSPLHLHSYVEYGLEDIFLGKKSGGNNSIPATGFSEEKYRKAKQDYTNSFMAAFEKDFPSALKAMNSSLGHVVTPEGLQIAGILLLTQHEFSKAQDKFEEAVDFLEKKVTFQQKKYFPPEYFETLIFQARTYDLLGKHKKAVSIYEKIENFSCLEDPYLRILARAKKRYTPYDLKKLILPFSMYTPFV